MLRNSPVRRRAASSAAVTILGRRQDELGSSSRMTPGSSAGRTTAAARSRQTALAMMRARLRALDPWRADALLARRSRAEFLLELVVFVPHDAPHRGSPALLPASSAPSALALRRRAPLLGRRLRLRRRARAPGARRRSTAQHLAGPYFATFVAAVLARRATRAAARSSRACAIAGAALARPADRPAGRRRRPRVRRSSSTSPRRCSSAGCCATARELNRALREKTAALERRRAGAAERAVADERARIAGELHDVVAHALSAMVVQAAAARAGWPRSAPGGARRVRRRRDHRPRGARRAPPAARRAAPRRRGARARARSPACATSARSSAGRAAGLPVELRRRGRRARRCPPAST